MALVTYGKLALPHEVPALLLERRTRLIGRFENDGGIARAPFLVPHASKEKVLNAIFSKHHQDLAPFFDKGVQMVGGSVGKKVTRRMLHSLSELKFNVWGEKDGGKFSANDYYALMRQKEKHGSFTPTFVQFDAKGGLAGAVFPIQVNTEDVTTHAHMISNHTYALDTITGPVLACPIICASGTTKNVGHTLIVKGVLPYAALLAYFGYISDLIAYSRPADYSPEKQAAMGILEHLPEDPNYKKFHGRNGARVVCVVEGGSGELDQKTGGYGFIAGYTTHLRPSEGMQAAFQKISRTVEKLLR